MRRGSRKFQQPNQSGPRINRQIRVPEVRLVGAEGEQIGVVSTQEALAKAEEIGLDLVEVSPNAKPPVCRLTDYGKFKYEQSKKAKEAKKKQSVTETKEITMRPGTEEHDLETKRKKIRKWAENKARIQVTVRFRGREMTHTELGHEAIRALLKGIEDLVAFEMKPKMVGRTLSCLLVPADEAKKKQEKKAVQVKRKISTGTKKESPQSSAPKSGQPSVNS